MPTCISSTKDIKNDGEKFPVKGEMALDTPYFQVIVNGGASVVKTSPERNEKNETWRCSSEENLHNNAILSDNEIDEKADHEKDNSSLPASEQQQQQQQQQPIKSPTALQHAKKLQTGNSDNLKGKPNDEIKKQNRSSQNNTSYSRSFRPRLVPAPVGYPYYNFPGYYSGAQQRPYMGPIAYGYHPAYVQYQAASNNHRLPTYNSCTSTQDYSEHTYTEEIQDGGENLSKTNLYIRGLPSTTRDEDLISMCQMYGDIISTKAVLHKDTNQSYGFVDFDSAASAQRAVVALQSKGIQAQMAKQQEQDPTNLYLSCLPKHMDEHQLQLLLSSYGHVISTRILRDSNGKSKCVGFARMESKDICEQIISKINGQYIPGAVEPVLVKFADGGIKKNKRDKGWRRPSQHSHDSYDIRNGLPTRSTPQPSTQVAPVFQNHMLTHGNGGAMTAYPISTVGVGWGVRYPSYAVSTLPHGVPGSPTQVETVPAMPGAAIPQITNQFAHMHIHGAGPNQFLVPAGAPGGAAGTYPQQQTWQVSQMRMRGPVPVEGEPSTVIMTASEVESCHPPPPQGQQVPRHPQLQQHPHNNGPIYSEVDHQTRVVYTPYAVRK